MFRDRDEELERLNRELLDEEEEEEEEETEEEIEESEQPAYRAYNTDTADVDLESYSEEVYTAPRRGCGFAVFFLLMTCILLLLFAWLLAKQGGLL